MQLDLSGETAVQTNMSKQNYLSKKCSLLKNFYIMQYEHKIKLFFRMFCEDSSVERIEKSTIITETNTEPGEPSGPGTAALPVECRASHRPAAWLHGRCPPVWSGPTGPSQDTDLTRSKQEINSAFKTQFKTIFHLFSIV